MGKNVRKCITASGVAKPAGPYSHAVQINDTLYLSGCLGQNPETGELVPGGFEAQCRQALVNIGTILKGAGGSHSNVVKVTVLLADILDFPSMNAIYREFFKDRLPVRTAYQVGRLPINGLVEIEVMAVLGELSEA